MHVQQTDPAKSPGGAHRADRRWCAVAFVLTPPTSRIVNPTRCLSLVPCLGLDGAAVPPPPPPSSNGTPQCR